MTNLREAFAVTALASLEWDENRERAIDRVAASGKAGELGLLLWKAKYQLEVDSYRRAQKALVEIYGKRYRDSPTVAAAFVGQAMREYLSPSCRACHGVGEYVVNDRRIVCETCGGSKIHRYSDEERARTMQVSYGLTKAGAHKLRWLLGLMGAEDSAVNFELNIQLERCNR